MGVRHENLIGKGASRAVVDETLEAYRTWEAARAAAIAAASQPSLVVTTASEWAAGDRALPDADAAARRRRGRRRRTAGRGASVGHRASARWSTPCWPRARSMPMRAPSRPSRARRRGCWALRRRRARRGRGRGSRVLASPWIRRAAASQRVPARAAAHVERRRERRSSKASPTSCSRRPGASVVVEFKTDVEIGRLGLERYRRQVGFYVGRRRARHRPKRQRRAAAHLRQRPARGLRCRGCRCHALDSQRSDTCHKPRARTGKAI